MKPGEESEGEILVRYFLKTQTLRPTSILTSGRFGRHGGLLMKSLCHPQHQPPSCRPTRSEYGAPSAAWLTRWTTLTPLFYRLQKPKFLRAISTAILKALEWRSVFG